MCKNNPTAALTLPTPQQSLKRIRTGVKQSLLQYTRPLHCTPASRQSLTWILLVVGEGGAGGTRRSRVFIQEELGLSDSTIKAHTSHVYQKLGVHSKQELISLVREA